MSASDGVPAPTPVQPVLGQGAEFLRLLERAAALRLPHALLLEGAPGTGKTTAALTFALALLDDGSDSVATRKQVAARSHPDLHFLSVREDRKEIAVEDVRALRVALTQSAFAGRARVAVIDPADRLNDEGQNALLKTLEEPGKATFMLVTTSRPEGLLPTVRSRVARYRVRPMARAALAQALHAARPAADAATRAWAVELAAGSLGFAQELVDEPAARVLHDKITEFIAGRARDPHALVDACLDATSGRDAVAERMRLVLRLVRSCLGARLRPGTEQGELALAPDGGQAYGSDLDRQIESCERVFEAEVDLQQHVAAEQVLLGLLLELAVPA